MDKNRVAANIRKHLERRLAAALGCEPQDLRNQKLGTLLHLAFLMHGDGESIGGFFTTLDGTLKLIGSDLLWQSPEDTSMEEEPKAEEKAVIN